MGETPDVCAGRSGENGTRDSIGTSPLVMPEGTVCTPDIAVPDKTTSAAGLSALHGHVLDADPTPRFVLDDHLRLVLLNPALADLLCHDAIGRHGNAVGPSPDTLTGRHITEVFTPEAFTQMATALADVQSGLSPAHALLIKPAMGDSYLRLRIFPVPHEGRTFIAGDLAPADTPCRSELQMFEQEATLRAIGDNLPDCAIFSQRVLPDGTIIPRYRSRSVSSLFGIPFEMAMNAQELLRLVVVPEDSHMFDANAIQAQGSFHGAIRIRRMNDGAMRWIQVHAAARPQPDGSSIWDGSVSDITHLKKQERSLRERDLTIRSIGDNMPDGMLFSVDAPPDGPHRYTYVSRGVERLFGLSAEAVLADPRALEALVVPEDRSRHTALQQHAIRTRTPFDMMLRIAVADGSRRIFHVRAKPRHDDGSSHAWDGVCTDVTTAVEQQHALRERESMLAAIGDNLPHGGIFRVSLDAQGLRFMYVSQGIERQLGIRPESLYKDSSVLLARFDRSDRALLREACQRCLDDGTPVDITVRYTHVSGRIHWLHLRMARHASDRACRILDGLAIDETQLVLQRDALREHERILTALGDSLHEGAIYTCEVLPEGTSRLLYASSQAGRLMGVPIQRLYDDFDAVVAERIHPEDLEGLAKAECHAQRTLEPLDLRLRILADGGEVRWLHVRSAPSPRAGGGFLWQGVVLDITALKRTEIALETTRRHLHDIIEAMPSALFGIDADENVTCWNAAARRLLGFGDPRPHERATASTAGDGEPREHPVMPLTSLPRLAPYAALVRTSLASGTTLRAERTALRLDSGQRFDDVVVYPLQDALKTHRGEAMLRLDDVTDRVRLEEMVVQNEKMLSIGGLAAGMAHEINNPLAGVLQGVQNVRRRFSPTLAANAADAEACGLSLEAMQQYMQRRGILFLLDGIRESGERAARIVRNMLEFSRRSSLEKIPTDLNALLHKVVEFASADFDIHDDYDFKRVHILFETQPDLPPILCAPGEMEQVLVNLVRNALHAMAAVRSTTPTITLRSRRTEKGVRIEVEDNGPGMSEDVRRKVFEPFFTTKAPGKGTGLGLSVSYFIVTRFHKGLLRVESAPGEGTRFIIELPA